MDKPKLLRDAKAVEERVAQLKLPHMLELTKFVERLRIEMGELPPFHFSTHGMAGLKQRCSFFSRRQAPKLETLVSSHEIILMKRRRISLR
tara:strand:+ start:15016 stop:15288 length:273 start_codon:yes stop_codon:yes gene_type:complete